MASEMRFKDITYDSMYLYLKNTEESCFKISQNLQDQVGWDKAIKCKGTDEFSNTDAECANQYSEIFKDTILINDVLCIVHGPFVSMYHILTKDWICHYKFEDDIKGLHREIKEDGIHYDPSVLL
jgi:hypothetical protein